MRVAASWVTLFVMSIVAGCAAPETVRLEQDGNRQASVLDGRQPQVSRKPSSIVLIRPASQQFQIEGRSVYVVGIYNLTKLPLKVSMQNVSFTQMIGGRRELLKVYAYEELQSQEINREDAATALVAQATVPQIKYGSDGGNVQSTTNRPYDPPRTAVAIHSTLDDPTATALARTNTSIQNEAKAIRTIEAGRQNLIALERTVMKDHALSPGEWSGGQLHLEAPSRQDNSRPKKYFVSLLVGPDAHNIEITEAAESK